MKCPNCGLINPATTERCDCGYDFPSGQMKESYLTRATQNAHVDKENQVEETGSSRDVGRRNMVVGGLWCIDGILFTAISYNAVASSSRGGSYFIAWGAIVFGAIQFFKGVFSF